MLVENLIYFGDKYRGLEDVDDKDEGLEQGSR